MKTLEITEKITLAICVIVVALINLFILIDKNRISLKQKTKITLLMLFVMSSFFMKSQDTIYFKDKTVVSAKILEVGITEIKYQRLDNLAGPDYLSSKKEIFLIKYSNGVTDSIKYTMNVPTPMAPKTEINTNVEKVVLSRNRIIYHGKTISDRSLRLMAVNHPNNETQLKLKKEFKKLNEYKLKESALAAGLFLFGTAIHGYALDATFGGKNLIGNRSNIVATFIVGAVLRISGHVVNIVNRNKKKHKRQEIVNIYNGI